MLIVGLLTQFQVFLSQTLAPTQRSNCRHALSKECKRALSQRGHAREEEEALTLPREDCQMGALETPTVPGAEQQSRPKLNETSITLGTFDDTMDIMLDERGRQDRVVCER